MRVSPSAQGHQCSDRPVLLMLEAGSESCRQIMSQDQACSMQECNTSELVMCNHDASITGLTLSVHPT